MRYITFLYDNWFLSNRAKTVELLFTARILFCGSVSVKLSRLITGAALEQCKGAICTVNFLILRPSVKSDADFAA